MDVFLNVLREAAHWTAFALVWILCLAGIGLSSLSLSGTWLVTAGALLALLVRKGSFPGIWTVVVFVLISAAVEGVEAIAGAWGVTRRGGSKLAGAAAVVGGLAGLLVGGIIPPPLVGSLIGMMVCSFGLVYLVERRRLRASGDAAGIAWGAVTARVLVIFVKVGVTIGMSTVLLAGMLFLSGCSRDGQRPAAGIRAVSLAPNLTEIVYAIGAQDCLVGRSSACDYPPAAARDVPAVGGFGDPSIETLLAARPTIVLEVDLADEALREQFAELGIRRERIPCQTLDQIPAAIRRVGELLDRAADAERVAGDFESRLAALRDRAAHDTDRPAVYVEIWHDPLMTAGRGTFVSDLVHLAGGRNIGDETDRNYFRVSSEWIVSHDPEIIVCTYMSDSVDTVERVKRRPGWRTIRAVRDGRICAGFDSDVILRPGPRALQAVEELRSCIAQQGTG